VKRRVLAAALLCLLLAGCAPTPAAQPEGQWQYTFTDSTGADVTLTRKPQTVAVLFSSYAQIWSLAGGTVAVSVGESIQRGFVPETVTLVDAGAGKTVDHEKLLAAQPDLVIGSADIAAQTETCRLLKTVGIPCALFRVDTFDEYLSMLKICTDITGNAGAYTAFGTDVQARIGQLLRTVADADVPQRDILFIRAGSQYSSTKAKRAPENFVCTMLAELGARNIADDAAVLLDGLSLEEILLRDPDRIFITTMGSEEAARDYIEDLFSQDGWRELTAVKTGSYTFLPKELFHFKPNAAWDEAYALLAELLYPELNLHGQTQ